MFSNYLESLLITGSRSPSINIFFQICSFGERFKVVLKVNIYEMKVHLKGFIVYFTILLVKNLYKMRNH